MKTVIDRRKFLGMSAGAGLAGILAASRAPAHAQGTTLRILRLTDTTPAADDVLARQMTDISRVLGAKVTLERVDVRQMAARVTAAISAGQGPDIVHLVQSEPYIYEQHLVDVSDVTEEIARAHGAFYGASIVLCRTSETWRAVPHAITPSLVVYRQSLHEQIGVSGFPKAWPDWYEAGRILKGRGMPIGQTVAHTLVDGPAFWYPFLWCWGAKEVESDGKTITLDTSATAESVRYAVTLWKDCCDPRGLAWSDTQNARAFLTGTIASTLSTASIYLTARDDPKAYQTAKGMPLHTDIRHAPPPGSRFGQYAYPHAYHHGVMSYSKNQTLAKDALRWLHGREAFEPWFVAQRGASIGPTRIWERHALWSRDPVMAPFRDAHRFFRLIGYSGRPSAKAAQVVSSHIMVDMYAKAIQGMPPEDAVGWATDELRKIYT